MIYRVRENEQLSHIHIHSMADMHTRELDLSTFVTLSPVPEFASWLSVSCHFADNQQFDTHVLLAEDTPVIEQLYRATCEPATPSPSAVHHAAMLQSLLSRAQGTLSPTGREILVRLSPILKRLCARYLLLEKRRKLALDSVANFHLRNGAQLHCINALADLSPNGLRRSHGMMVNYLYDFEQLERNNTRYLLGDPIACSPEVAALLHSPSARS